MVCRHILVGCLVVAAGCGRSGGQKTSQEAGPRDATAPADAPILDAAEAAIVDLSSALIVRATGELVAIDRREPLTRTGGAVVASLRVTKDRIAYVTRTNQLGVLDLATGSSSALVDVGAAGPIVVAWSVKAPEGVWVGSGAPKLLWRRLDGDRLVALPKKTVAPSGPRLEVTATGAKLVATPTSLVTADWDELGLASAIRIKTSNRVVAAPSPGLIDGASIVWSPGKSHLAFVAHLDDTCAQGASTVAAYVADAATGTLTELDRAVSGHALEWVSDRTVAVAGDAGVSLIDLDGGPRRTLEGELVAPRRRPKCADQEITPASRVDGGADDAVVEPPPGVRSSTHQNP